MLCTCRYYYTYLRLIRRRQRESLHKKKHSRQRVRITCNRGWINRVWLVILLVVRWTGKIIFSLSPFAPENMVPRDGCPVPPLLIVRGSMFRTTPRWDGASHLSTSETTSNSIETSHLPIPSDSSRHCQLLISSEHTPNSCIVRTIAEAKNTPPAAVFKQDTTFEPMFFSF